MRGDPQSDNSGAEAGGASLARRRASRGAGTEGPSAVEKTCLPVSGPVGRTRLTQHATAWWVMTPECQARSSSGTPMRPEQTAFTGAPRPGTRRTQARQGKRRPRRRGAQRLCRPTGASCWAGGRLQLSRQAPISGPFPQSRRIVKFARAREFASRRGALQGALVVSRGLCPVTRIGRRVGRE